MKRLLSGDMLLRAASLGLAIVLWVTIAGRDTAERGISAPVEFRNVPPSLELTGDMVDHVNVRLRASPGLVESLAPGEVRAAAALVGLARVSTLEGNHEAAAELLARVPDDVSGVRRAEAALALAELVEARADDAASSWRVAVELAEQSGEDATHLSAAVAVGASAGLAARLAARAPAALAVLGARYGNLLLAAQGGFHEVDTYFVAQVGAPL